QIVHAGDICGAHVLETLERINPNITAVAGNNDVAALWDIHEAHIVTALPQMVDIQLPGGTLAIEHGHRHGMHTPCHQSLRDSHPHARAIVYGHTHSMVVDKEHPTWVVNPGAAGETRTRGGASCLILTASEEAWEVEMFRFSIKEVA
ncbi:MAG: metallophosphatase family protein, partial [Gammaproteobacteria bacterium]|nr:metallophosphatase family protein [Gammaproteobacteria bacterium]